LARATTPSKQSRMARTSNITPAATKAFGVPRVITAPAAMPSSV